MGRSTNEELFTTQQEIETLNEELVARVSVKDQGMGISKVNQPHLFDRFFRVESQEMENVGGFGIDLYICDEIIRRHHGKIWVESELGNGSTFHFSIPTKRIFP